MQNRPAWLHWGDCTVRLPRGVAKALLHSFTSIAPPESHITESTIFATGVCPVFPKECIGKIVLTSVNAALFPFRG